MVALRIVKIHTAIKQDYWAAGAQAMEVAAVDRSRELEMFIASDERQTNKQKRLDLHCNSALLTHSKSIYILKV